MSEELDILSESLETIHDHVEKLAHLSKYLYSSALRIQQMTEHPNLDLWSEPYKLHERAQAWAKSKMVASKCSLWEVHQTLVESAKRENRVFYGHMVRLTDEEATIMELPANHTISVWLVLGKLPRFFI